MALEGLRGYLQLASGLTEVTRRSATAVARSLLASGGAAVGARMPEQVRATVASVSALADEIAATGRANRELMLGLVRGEIDRAVARLGLVNGDQLDALSRELDAVAGRVARLEAAAGAPPRAPRARKSAGATPTPRPRATPTPRPEATP